MEISRLRVCASFLALGLLSVASANAADIPPAEAFGSIPQISEVELSPSGKFIAWAETTAQGAQALTFDLDAHKNKRAFPIGNNVTIRSLSWSDDETLLITVGGFVTYGETQSAHHYDVERTFSAD